MSQSGIASYQEPTYEAGKNEYNSRTQQGQYSTLKAGKSQIVERESNSSLKDSGMKGSGISGVNSEILPLQTPAKFSTPLSTAVKPGDRLDASIISKLSAVSGG